VGESKKINTGLNGQWTSKGGDYEKGHWFGFRSFLKNGVAELIKRFGHLDLAYINCRVLDELLRYD